MFEHQPEDPSTPTPAVAVRFSNTAPSVLSSNDSHKPLRPSPPATCGLPSSKSSMSGLAPVETPHVLIGGVAPPLPPELAPLVPGLPEVLVSPPPPAAPPVPPLPAEPAPPPLPALGVPPP